MTDFFCRGDERPGATVHVRSDDEQLPLNGRVMTHKLHVFWKGRKMLCTCWGRWK
jgi:hypothetical protein